MSTALEMHYEIDITAPLVMQDAKTIMVEGDNKANTLVLEVLDGKQPAVLTGCTATAYMIRSDGYRPFATCEINGNIVTVALDKSFYFKPGRYNLFVRLTEADGETKRTILLLNGWVQPEGAEGTIDPDETLPTLDELLAQLAKIEEAVIKAETVVNMSAKAETLPAGCQATASYKNGVLSLGVPHGAAGYSPVKNVDYWTPAEQEAVVKEATAAVSAEVAAELAKRGQVKPEFANSIAECTDTSKLYVLPDGCFYAYMGKTGAAFTNLVPNAIGADGKPYNGGLGYKYGSYYTSSFAEGSKAGYERYILTGFIPVNFSKNKTIRVSGFNRAYSEEQQHPDDYEYICFADNNFSIFANQRGRIRNYLGSYAQTYESMNVNGENVYVFTFNIDTMKSASPWYGGEIENNTAYVSFSVNTAYMDMERFFVTVDEEITFGTTWGWMNTGHAFVPTDYENRIIDLEQSNATHENRIRTLEMQGQNSVTGEEVPAYIKTAADEVIAKVMERQGNRAFNIIAMSDFHYGGIGDNKDNLIRACKAVSYITGRIHIDAVATLGDNVPFGTTDDKTLNSGPRWFNEINEILAVTQAPGIVDFRTAGNHDRAGGNDASGNPTEPFPDNAIYSYIMGYNRQCEIGNVPGGWGYKDFSGHKLRVIVMNTSEVEGKGRFSTYSGYHISTAQYKWLIDTLDLSDKADASDWQILVLSHHKADDYQAPATNATTNNYILPNILHAYNKGGSYTGVNAEDGATISCNFSGKNSAKLIGQIHGHHHAYIYGLLKLASNGTETGVMAISTPTTAFGTGAGHNDDNNDVYYNSVKDTAEETAFCLYSIDLDNHVIHAIHYGNGIDREIAY